MTSEQQVVIVTGGARGIGLGIAQCFAEKGASLVIADSNLEQAVASARQLEEAGASGALGLACDVTQRTQVESMIVDTVARFGRIDVLVNNAGICPFEDIMKMTPEVWQRTIDINLTGAFHCTQLVARQLIEQGHGGSIVFITSLSTNFTNPSQVDYAASKAGLRMTMKGFAAALGQHGITCNAVAPGMMLTPMTEHYWGQPGPAEHIKKRVPVGRIGVPQDIGRAVVFLASPEASYISGTTLRVDGGFETSCS
jgi:NAD(P)-dependent dehydrogenase (short-subunit alcohol dehydrogenase family)